MLGLESLRRLTLDKNRLTAVPIGTLRALAPTLEELYLSVNRLDSLDFLPPLPHLKALALEVNRIDAIHAMAFAETPNLLYLYLGNNAFTAIEPQMFEHLRRLRVLSMNYNPIVGSLERRSK